MFENVVVGYIAPVISELPSLDLSGIFAQPGVQDFINILSVVSYFFPWNSVLGIVGIICGFQTVRIIIAFLRSLWDILPIV